MRVLVTGGAGFIGSHLVDALLGRGDEVTVVDDLSTGRRDRVPAEARFLAADICDPGVAGLLADVQPDRVYHLAARASVSASIKDPPEDARTNLLGTVCLATAAAEAGARFTFASSAAVYGRPESVPLGEDARIRPLSPYGAGKAAAETYLSTLRETRGLASVSLRFANVYGPRQDAHGEAGVVAVFCAALKAGQPLTIHGDGGQTRDFIYVTDVVSAILAASNGLEGPLNVGAGVETSIRELATAACEVAGRPPSFLSGPARVGDIERSALDATRLRQATAWAPATDLRPGLAATLADLR